MLESFSGEAFDKSACSRPDCIFHIRGLSSRQYPGDFDGFLGHAQSTGFLLFMVLASSRAVSIRALSLNHAARKPEVHGLLGRHEVAGEHELIGAPCPIMRGNK